MEQEVKKLITEHFKGKTVTFGEFSGPYENCFYLVFYVNKKRELADVWTDNGNVDWCY